MNVALPALVGFLLLWPGFVLRARLRRIERTSLDYSPFGQVVAEATGWAMVLHLAWLALAWWLLGQRLRVDVLLGLMGSEARTQAAAVEHISRTGGWVAAYFLSLYGVAFLGGDLARRAVSRFELDRTDRRLGRVFRFDGAPWYYLLTAADRPRAERPDLIYVSAVVDVGKEAVLYSGVLEQFHVDEGGQLDRLVLSAAQRRAFSADKTVADAVRDDRFYPIDGDFFVLRYAEAVTLNVQYVRLQEAALDEGAAGS